MNTTKNIKWSCIIPLIGGSVVAGKAGTGVDPAFLMSYSPFAGNEENIKAHMPHVPFYTLDDPDTKFDVSEHQDLDFVTALCPCAGLSRLSNGTPEQRAKMNTWMLNTAKFVTEEVRPKVFWGENAPGLFTGSGELVKNQLLEQAKAAGYSFSLYLTDTSLHGIPQRRKRTFYFFWRDSTAPIMEFYSKPKKTLSSYLEEVPAGVTRHTDEDLAHAKSVVDDNPYMKFMRSKYGSEAVNKLREFKASKEQNRITLFMYLIQTDQMPEMVTWLRDNGHPRQEREAARIHDVVTAGKGFWDGSFSMFDGQSDFGTVMSRTLYTIHPTEDRMLTPREFMHLMGLPHDFNLVGSNINQICQNVPVCTATDMTREVIAFLEGKRQLSGEQFIKQNNIRKVNEQNLISNPLFEF